MLRRVIISLIVLGFAIGLLTLGVRWKKQQPQDAPLARVYGKYLYKDDLPTARSGAAPISPQMQEQYIQDWAVKQLLLSEAESRSSHAKEDLERSVLDYRHALLVHSFLEDQVAARINSKVSDEDIKTYYHTHRDQLLLNMTIFKGKFVVVPKKVPHRARLIRLLRGGTPSVDKALADYCSRFAVHHSLDGKDWLQWDHLLQGTSLATRSNNANLLGKGKVLQTSDTNHFYYFKIDEFHKIGSVAPLEFIKPRVTAMILHQRKAHIIDAIKRSVLKKAKSNNKCIIYE